MIRLINSSDIKAILDIYRPFVNNTCISFETLVPSLEDFKERVFKIEKNYPYLVYLINDKIVGYAYASRFRERQAYDLSTEVSVYVKDEYQGIGIGKKLMKALINELIKQNIRSVISCIRYPNIKSENLFKSLGFKKCGHFHECGYKLNEYSDIVFYEYLIINEDHKFIPYSEIKEKYIGENI